MSSFQREPLWYKDAVIYQVHVKSFFDAESKGIGNFQGLIKKLDYIRNLGVTAIWLLPFYPSPMRDDGYDIADYQGINPAYGTLDDFKQLLAEAHLRGIYVITELVINHTSDQHPWFLRARQSPSNSDERNFYVWCDKPDKYLDARIIFKDFETSNWSWDPVAKAYYWHRFYSHQPDLNFDHPAVHDAILDALDFWLKLGVDGLRLDAVPYLYERDGTICENLPETHAYLKKLSAHVRDHYENRMLLAEANQWPDDAAQYFGQGDECEMAFHFPLMPRLYMALEMDDAFPIVDILEQTPTIPESCQWAIFLRNHDELTLEMVSDEERDFMYRVYARDIRSRINLGIRRRLAPLLANDRRKMELMNSLLLSLPGTPVIYYGDEIGMGDNFYLGDRNGVRTPMQWSPERNAGFSQANSQQLFLPIIIDPEFHYETVNVENQDRNPTSLLWWMRQRLLLRRQHPAFSQGSINFPKTDNNRVLVFTRSLGSDNVLIAANLSRYPQTVGFDLSRFLGEIPVEMTGHARFPIIGSDPYRLMLGSHDTLWLKLGSGQDTDLENSIPQMESCLSINECMEGYRVAWLMHHALPRFFARSQFAGIDSSAVDQTRIIHTIPISTQDGEMFLTLIEFGARPFGSQRYLLPIGFISDLTGITLPKQTLIARITLNGRQGYLCNASNLAVFRSAILGIIIGKQRILFKGGELIGTPSQEAQYIPTPFLVPSQLQESLDQVQYLFQDTCVLRLFNKPNGGSQVDSELTEFLTKHTSYRNTPFFLGSLDLQHITGGLESLGFLQSLISSDRDGFVFAVESASKFIDGIRTEKEISSIPWIPPATAPLTFEELPQTLQLYMGGTFCEFIHILGERTAELHQALASCPEFSGFEPEQFTSHHLAALHQSIRTRIRREFVRHQKSIQDIGDEAQKVEHEILDKLRSCLRDPIQFDRIRIHGSLRLSQALFTGKDFILKGFGETSFNTEDDRYHKLPALRDVASMLLSFRHAGAAALNQKPEHLESDTAMKDWVAAWAASAGSLFLNGYLLAATGSTFIPDNPEAFTHLLKALLLDRMAYDWSQQQNEGLPDLQRRLKALQSVFED